MTYKEFYEVKNQLRGSILSKDERYIIANVTKKIEACRVIPEIYDEKINNIKQKHCLI